jgi:hemerythrin
MNTEYVNKSLDIGIDIIDEQHNKILETLQQFVSNIKNGIAVEKIKHEFRKLNILVDEHLYTEENLLKKYNCQDYEEHLKEHTMMNEKLIKFYDLLQLDFVSGFPETILNSLLDTIKNHVIEKDSIIFTYRLKKKLDRVV